MCGRLAGGYGLARQSAYHPEYAERQTTAAAVGWVRAETAERREGGGGLVDRIRYFTAKPKISLVP